MFSIFLISLLRLFSADRSGGEAVAAPMGSDLIGMRCGMPPIVVGNGGEEDKEPVAATAPGVVVRL